MGFFGVQYQVLFHDTMAYGSHHYLTNLKFQNYARETLLFETQVDGKNVWQEELKDYVLLTREAYTLNMGPVVLGEKVGILMTYEEPTRSTVRLCFRIVREDGMPVSCGFQTMVFMNAETFELEPTPRLVSAYLDTKNEYCLLEELQDPSFGDILREGGNVQSKIFTDEIIDLGKYIAAASRKSGYPKIIDFNKNEYDLGETASFEKEKVVEESATTPEVKHNKLIFTFPGQGSYLYSILRDFYLNDSESKEFFLKADEVANKMLRRSFLSLVEAASQEAHDAIHNEFKDLDQLGIYLTEVLVARRLMAIGIVPDLLLGHSFGEIAALAIAGVYSFDDGLEIVCHRIKALKQHAGNGKMAALFCDRERAQSIIKEYQLTNTQVAVVNKKNQTVVSGTQNELNLLSQELPKKGISVTILKSNYPFHSELLREAVAPFKASLGNYSYKEARIPVYHCTENQLYKHSNDLPEILATQFVKPLHFTQIVEVLARHGFTNYIECGGGDIVSKLITKNEPNAIAKSAGLPSQPVAKNIDEVVRFASQKGWLVPEKKMEFKVEQPAKMPVPVNVPISTNDTQTEKVSNMPIAIVSMGSILPGANNPDEFWNNVVNGISGIVDLKQLDPNAEKDFMEGHARGMDIHLVPDKTYSLLNGTIVNIEYESELLENYYSQKEFEALTRGQRMLALALAQNMPNIRDEIRNLTSDKMQCILGATADGISEYDEAVFVDGVINQLEKTVEDEQVRAQFQGMLHKISGYSRGDSIKLEQSKIYKEVVYRFLEKEIKTYIIDTACSSSLYAIDMGVKALRNGESDLVLAGGVFAPGPSNNTLFAQFRGLSPTGSRPLDETADGVVFADGSAIVVLKRLTDAIRNDDTILGVIRGFGLSSDGKAPSINVPKSEGQVLAMERAMENAGTDIDSVQFIEMHATATPVGDSVEFNTIKTITAKRNPSLSDVHIGSVKSLIGHTGWVSGVASVVKLCKAFEHQVMPKQFHCEKPNEKMEFEGSHLCIPTENKPWTKPMEGQPMRAGVNGFGFGGTNAHVVLESFDKAYHSRLISETDSTNPAHIDLAIVAASNMFPGEGDPFADQPGESRHFDRSKFRLPRKKMLLPDVTENMDASQYLAPLAAEQMFDELGDGWNRYKAKIGTVFGLESKTERGVTANERILCDRLMRQVHEFVGQNGNGSSKFIDIAKSITTHFKKHNHISGPYTLPGLMPNVASSRITSIYNLNGPNIVVDDGENSFFQSLLIAEQLLINKDCDIVFSGGIGAYTGITDEYQEASCLYALTTKEFAQKNGLEIKSILNIGDVDTDDATRPVKSINYRGANGGPEFYQGYQKCLSEGESFSIREFDGNFNKQFSISKDGISKAIKGSSEPKKSVLPDKLPSTHAYVQGTPITCYEPALFKSPAVDKEASLQGWKILFLTDQPQKWLDLERSGVLDPFDYSVGVHSVYPLKNGVHIDLTSDDRSQESLKQISNTKYDLVLAVKFLDQHEPDMLLESDFQDQRSLIDLLFAASKFYYHDIYEKKVAVASMCMGAFRSDKPDPYTGLVNGFMKSLSRELTDSLIRMINTDELHFLKATHQLEIELGQKSNDWEVSYINGDRNIIKLVPIDKLAADDQPCISKDSVIIATGGGRGVTAVLAEQLLKQYGCTVIGLGRTSPDSAPKEILETDPIEFLASEAQFYKDQIELDKTQKVVDLKKKFQKYQAANELYHVIKSLNALPGRFVYRTVDINSVQEIDALIESVYQEFGKVDMVMHGAGIQKSGMLANKPLEVFQNVVETKVASLGYLYRAIQRRNTSGNPVHYHLLTSAFSVLGNDGQPDYGAANEWLNRTAAAMYTKQPDAYWSSLAWLGWAGIGMTRSTEYAALAASRRLRGVTKSEGQEIFQELMQGRPSAAINVTMAQGEFDYYGFPVGDRKEIPDVQVLTSKKSNISQLLEKKLITIENTEFLKNHVVDDIPTMPGALMTCIASEAACKLRPNLKIIEFEDTNSYRFVRIRKDKGLEIRIKAEVVSENENETVIKTQILSDFVHRSGRILQKDILHNETLVHMAKEVAPQPDIVLSEPENAVSLPDPYCMNDIVKLLGQFDSMYNIKVGDTSRKAEYMLKQFDFDSPHNYLIANMMLMDTFWRFGTIKIVSESRLGVYVPEKCRSMKVFYDFTDFENPQLMQHFTFYGPNPRSQGRDLLVGPLVATNAEGKIMLIGDGGFARNFGEVDFKMTEKVLQ